MKTKQFFLLSMCLLFAATSLQAQTDNPPVGDVDKTLYREIDGIFYKLRGGEAKVFERFNDDKLYFDDIVIPPTVTYQGVEYTVTSIGNNAFYNSYGMTSIELPNTVTSIGTSAFYGCIGLRAIVIPKSVVSIGETAFTKCSGLSSIYIPKGVTSIGENTFNSCSCLTSIKVEDGNPVYDSRNDCNAIIITATNSLKVGCENTIIPNTVTTIMACAFSYRRFLTSIEIPNSVKTIEAAFFGSSLYTISLPASVKSIGAMAFQSCPYLTSVSILGSDVYIGDEAFSYCRNLKSFTIFATEPPKISDYTFIGSPEDMTLHVLPGCEEAYANAENWSRFNIVGDAQMTNIEALDVITSSETYDLLGRPVDDGYKGIAIRNGKKIIIK